MTDGVLARVVALKTMPTADLKAMWKELNGKESPAFNRPFLESRLAYRIQELELGGLKPETKARLEALGRELARDGSIKRRGGAGDRPVVGTRLVREWQGAEHVATVRADGYEWQGRPFKSLSAVANAISGGHQNGWTFFGLRQSGGSR